MREVISALVFLLFGFAAGLLFPEGGPINNNVITVSTYKMYEHRPGDYTIERKLKDSHGEVWVYESVADSREKAMLKILDLQKNDVEHQLVGRFKKKLERNTEEF